MARRSGQASLVTRHEHRRAYRGGKQHTAQHWDDTDRLSDAARWHYVWVERVLSAIDNLEHVHTEWLRRLQGREITREEARAVLQVMNGRLEFLRNLHSGIADHAEFAEQARDVEQEIEREADEIKMVERYIEQADGAE